MGLNKINWINFMIKMSTAWITLSVLIVMCVILNNVSLSGFSWSVVFAMAVLSSVSLLYGIWNIYKVLFIDPFHIAN
ncbi:putative membrane protein YqjE [Paenibacillus sp. 1182]|uniref:hypothetical protein n=1 Tax=Paenibacillus sp. 1182 TaxID=2806565 RepID=UPI001AE8B506|nr:hypothetical protein [Paenibacillus sp. 1182]MBP1309123.1 putative membrane protein YqjE [Paenibacillus sp. 1182]